MSIPTDFSLCLQGTNPTQDLAEFSSYGPLNDNNPRIKPEVVAPGKCELFILNDNPCIEPEVVAPGKCELLCIELAIHSFNSCTVLCGIITGRVPSVQNSSLMIHR